MSETEKMLNGELFNPMSSDLSESYQRNAHMCHKYNLLASTVNKDIKKLVLNTVIKKHKNKFTFKQPFYCEFGENITLGENFFASFGCTIMAYAPVIFGRDVLVGPNCNFFTVGHPINPIVRKRGLDFAKEIHVGNNVWIGGGCTILPNVHIGDNSVIGAGSVVTKDIPANVVAAGNPCVILHSIKTAIEHEAEQYTR